MSSAATRRRVFPATSREPTFTSRALACAAERSYFASTGMSSSSCEAGRSSGCGLYRASGAGRPGSAAPLLVVDDRPQAASRRRPLEAQTRSGDDAGSASAPATRYLGGETTTVQEGRVGGEHLERDRPLVRVHPDHHTLCCCFHAPLGSSVRCGCRAGRASPLRAEQTPLRLPRGRPDSQVT
jgi:hypothetical protein